MNEGHSEGVDDVVRGLVVVALEGGYVRGKPEFVFFMVVAEGGGFCAVWAASAECAWVISVRAVLAGRIGRESVMEIFTVMNLLRSGKGEKGVLSSGRGGEFSYAMCMFEHGVAKAVRGPRVGVVLWKI